MRPVVAVFALAACNQVYGLDSTSGPTSDVSPTQCPPLGQAPKFARQFHQVVPQDCFSYHFNDTGAIATATCGSEIFAGARDQPLTATGVFSSRPGVTTQHFFPRPAQSGRRFYVARHVTQPQSAAIVAFDEVNGSWVDAGAQSLPHTFTMRPSTVFHGPTGDRLFMIDTIAKTMREYELEGGAWVPRGAARVLPTGFYGYETLSLTSDGLRAVFTITSTTANLYYMDRRDLDSAFGEPQMLAGAPTGITEAHLSDDCTQLYFLALDSIFYARQDF